MKHFCKFTVYENTPYSKTNIEKYVSENAQSKLAFENWLSIIKWVEWKEPKNIISTFNSADILGESSKRVVFNIGGNKYRMICSYHFGKKKVHLFIKWIGTHSEYTTLCAEGKQYTVEAY